MRVVVMRLANLAEEVEEVKTHDADADADADDADADADEEETLEVEAEEVGEDETQPMRVGCSGEPSSSLRSYMIIIMMMMIRRMIIIIMTL